MARFTGTQTLPTTAAPYVSGPLGAGLGDRATGTVFSDTAGNLIFEHASYQNPAGGYFWDVADTIPVTASTGVKFSIELVSPYYRIRYVPTTNPTVFRLATRQSSAGRN